MTTVKMLLLMSALIANSAMATDEDDAKAARDAAAEKGDLLSDNLTEANNEFAAAAAKVIEAEGLNDDITAAQGNGLTLTAAQAQSRLVADLQIVSAYNAIEDGDGLIDTTNAFSVSGAGYFQDGLDYLAQGMFTEAKQAFDSAKAAWDLGATDAANAKVNYGTAKSHMVINMGGALGSILRYEAIKNAHPQHF